MRPTVVWHLLAGTMLTSGCAHPLVREDASLQTYFGTHDAAFVLRDLSTGHETRYGGTHCERRVSPCSTFKVPHLLAAVDAGVADETTVFKWDGTPLGSDTWDQDQTLPTALRRSAVWCFEIIARDLGRERERHYLRLFDYGNRDCSGPLDRFWIMSSLKISAAEQVGFLARLYRGRLRVSEKAKSICLDAMIMERATDCVLSGKTGSGLHPGDTTLTVINNWFVGHLRVGEGEWVFATNIQGPVKNRLEAQNITLAILRDRIPGAAMPQGRASTVRTPG